MYELESDGVLFLFHFLFGTLLLLIISTCTCRSSADSVSSISDDTDAYYFTLSRD